MTDAPVSPTTEVAGAIPEAPKAEFASMEGRTRIVPLQYPIRFAGTVYTEIPIRRITGAEMASFVSGISVGADPAYPGVGVPREVYEALDADDATAFNQALQDFFPLVLAEASGPDQPKSGR